MDTDKGPLPHSENRTAQRNHRKKLQGHMEDLERQDESSLVAPPQTSLEFRDHDRKEGSDHEDDGYHETFEEMSTIMTSAPTKLISSQCRECLDLFQRLRSLLEELDEDASSEYEKHESLKILQEAFLHFQAWSANIGALHSEHLQSSLDYRLREAKNIRERIMKVLRHLAKSLDDASSMISEQRANRLDSSSESDLDSDESETSLNITHTPERTEKTELQGLLSTTQGSISNLMKLSMIIRNSPARDDYPKAAARYQFDPRYDIGHVIEKHGKSKFSKTWLLERLGRAITIRRQYLTYRKEHHGKLSRDWDEVVRQTKGKDNVTVAKSAALTKATTFYEERHEEQPEYSKEVSFSPAGSQTSYDPTEFSGPNSSKLAVPPHPIMAFDDVVFEYGRPFLCPYCYIEQQVKRSKCMETTRL